jgi:Dual specificity phosphatase, catalytic domain
VNREARRSLKYGVVFTLLAVLLAWSAISSAGEGEWWVPTIEGYLAIGLFSLAIAYGMKQVGVPVEEVARDPRWTFALHVLLTPYRLLAWLCLALMRRIDRKSSMSRVGTGLFVGRLPSRAEQDRLVENGIDAALNLCAEFPRPSPSGAGSNVLYVPMLDGSPPSDRQLSIAVDWIVARRSEGRTVLIHCAQGHGRSATVAAVALCRLGEASGFDEAIEQIRASRPKAQPSKDQRSAAIRFLASEQP